MEKKHTDINIHNEQREREREKQQQQRMRDLSFENKHMTKLAPFNYIFLCVQCKKRTNNIRANAQRIESESKKDKYSVQIDLLLLFKSHF